MIDKSVAEEIKRLVRYENKSLLDILEKPYKSPKNYPKWEYEVLSFLGKSFDPYTKDKVNNYAINVANCLIDVDFPTYYVSKELAISLWNTNSSLHTKDLNIAQPSVLFIFPFNCIKTPENDDLTSIGIVSTKKNSSLQELYNYHGNGLLASSLFLRNKNHKTWYIYGIHNTSSFNQGLAQDNYQEYFIDNFGIPVQIEDENETKFLDKFRSFCFNLMFILEKRPELIEEVKIQPKGFGNTNKKDFRNPIWLGKDYKIKYVYEKSNLQEERKGNPKKVHFRKGYYRRQKYGKDLQKEKIIFIDPVIVNAKKEN